MLEEEAFFDYSIEPGRCLKTEIRKIPDNKKPLISIITSYYNAKEYIQQTANCVLNQTFPYWEWIIVNDGSTEEGTEEQLKRIEEIDERIHVYNKINEGLAKGRDYAISKTSDTQYVFPLDADDLIIDTMLECVYIAALENPKATWVYSNLVSFEEMKYLDNRKFDLEKMKKDNMITATALIKKSDILDVGGYGIAKRYVNEDWYLWLRLMQKGCYPIKLNFYGMWYRRKKIGLLKQVNDPKSKTNQLRIEEIKKQANKIKYDIKAIEYPLKEESKITINLDMFTPINKDSDTILIITPCLKTDRILKEIIKNNIENKCVIVTTKESNYIYRQKYEEVAEVFDITTFLSKNNIESFIEYLVRTRTIKKIVRINDENTEINIKKIKIKFENLEELVYKYEENFEEYDKIIQNYKKSRKFFRKAIRKIKRILKIERKDVSKKCKREKSCQ